MSKTLPIQNFKIENWYILYIYSDYIIDNCLSLINGKK